LGVRSFPQALWKILRGAFGELIMVPKSRRRLKSADSRVAGRPVASRPSTPTMLP